MPDPSWLPTQLPEDVEAERSLLATLCAPGMERQAADIVPDLEDEAFVVPKNRALLRALRVVVQKGSEVNALTLRDELARQGQLDVVEGFAGLTELLAAEEVGRPKVLADILRRKHQQRLLIRVGAGLVRQAGEDDCDPGALSDDAAGALFAMRRAAGEEMEAEPLRHRAMEFMTFGTPLLPENKRRNLLSFGVPHLDHKGRFGPGTFGVVAARPSCGKSTLMLQTLLHTRDAAFLSLEMGEEEVDASLIANLTGRTRDEVLREGVQPGLDFEVHAMGIDERVEVDQKLLALNNPARLCRWRNPTPEVIMATIRRMAMRGRRVFLVDYFQLLRIAVAKGENLAYALTRASRDFKLLARELDVCIVVASQFNREVADGQVPNLQHLRDSSGLETDPDWVLMLWTERPKYEDGEDRTVLWQLEKNRGGSRWVRGTMSFQPARARFLQLDRGTADPTPQAPPAAKPLLA